MIFNSRGPGRNRNASRRVPLWIGLALLGGQFAALSSVLSSTVQAANSASPTATAPTPSAASATAPTSAQPLDPTAAARFAALALSCLHREYPNKAAHVMESDADALPPHVLTPAFYGCFD